MALTSRRGARRPKVDDALELARVCARIAEDKKGQDILILDLRNMAYVTDYFVIASGTNPRQLQAMSLAVQQEMARRGVKPLGIEGQSQGLWILLDYGDFVVHLFDQEWRKLYDLELLWGDAPRLTWAAARCRRTVARKKARPDRV